MNQSSLCLVPEAAGPVLRAATDRIRKAERTRRTGVSVRPSARLSALGSSLKDPGTSLGWSDVHLKRPLGGVPSRERSICRGPRSWVCLDICPGGITCIPPRSSRLGAGMPLVTAPPARGLLPCKTKSPQSGGPHVDLLCCPGRTWPDGEAGVVGVFSMSGRFSPGEKGGQLQACPVRFLVRTGRSTK